MNNFYVIIYDPNSKSFLPYDVIPYLEKRYNEEKEKPKTFEEFKSFIIKCSEYQWWSRCEYEIVLSDWPSKKTSEKISVHYQVLLNLDIIVRILMESKHGNKE